jgi:hypothetical protein
MGHKQFWKLKGRTVAGIRVDDELSVGDVLRKNERVNRRNHYVTIPIHDERRLLNGFELRITLSAHLAPCGSCCSLSRHRLERTRR